MAAWWSGTDELVRWGTPARMDRTDRRLLGREDESAQIDALLGDPEGPRLVLVRGEPGVGRSAFLHAAGERLGARGTAVRTVLCASADGERPLLLVLRLLMALEECPSGPEEHQAAQGPVARALSAVDRRDRSAMETLLRTALDRGAPVAVLVDDVQYADRDSLDVLSRMEWPRGAPDARLVMSAARHVVPGGGGAVDRPAGVEGARTIVLGPLGTHDITELAARWLRAEPDAALAGRTAALTRGVPGAVDALLTGWTRRGDIRIADGHAFLGARAQVPVLSDDDRYVAALDRLGGPSRAVAAALSVLGPLGPVALELTAVRTGLSPATVGDAVRGLVEAGIVDELPGPGGTAAGGWAFRLPLTAHTVRERLSPVERSRLSAAAVEVLWESTDSPGTGPAMLRAPGLLDGTSEPVYRADRIAEAGSLVDRERAVAELTAAARRMRPGTDDGRVLRWLQAARDLTEHADARDPVLQQYAAAAYSACDHSTGRAVGELLLRDPGPTLDELDLQEAACLVVAVTAGQRDRPTVSRLATAHWWDGLPVPALAGVTGRALALCHLSRWRETAELLERTEEVWNTSPRARVTPTVLRALADLAMGRPERHLQALAMTDAPELPPGKVYSLAGDLFDHLLTSYDLDAARTLLQTVGLPVDVLPPLSRFLYDHATGRWDRALESARRLLANGEIRSTPASDSSLLPARTAAVLLARGRVNSALQTVEDTRAPDGSPPQCALHASEAQARLLLGDLDVAERTLRHGLGTARAHGQVHGTDELWALLAETTTRLGRAAEASACREHLQRIAARTGNDRSGLLHRLVSARLPRPDSLDTAPRDLREAVDLARVRGLPFETATTLLTAATAGAVPARLLHEAYELFGTIGAALWRHHTRTALRAAQLPVPDRKRTTYENDHLLATLIAEGLTNHQIAGVLRLSEDAVAQRLSRLFSRTGLRSRTEVVTAVLTGSF
ncbi:AAA family ATPase [Streptomyces sp. VNUA24]|uniref:AAA family ATPase n=1 Tax=Streptomyces sp. VNUA24 TaxID=3031131 RepID=UPI0023B7FD82|nr:AAA family ATPase [Streptomyces sp. VNUA24]WEH14506.1 AAA family ATPase [Streptomyces sp. VNUA24]